MGKSQLRLLRELDVWGEIGPNAEEVVGCTGAAFNAVLNAVISKGYVTERMVLTDAGRAAIAMAESPAPAA